MAAIRAIEASKTPITTTELLSYVQVEPSQEVKEKAATISRLIDDPLIKRLLETRDTAFSRLFHPGSYDPPARVSWGHGAGVVPDVPPVALYVVYDEVRPMTREDFDRAEEALRGRPTYDPRVGR